MPKSKLALLTLNMWNFSYLILLATETRRSTGGPCGGELSCPTARELHNLWRCVGGARRPCGPSALRLEWRVVQLTNTFYFYAFVCPPVHILLYSLLVM